MTLREHPSIDIEAVLRSVILDEDIPSYWPAGRLELRTLRDDLLAHLKSLHRQEFGGDYDGQLVLETLGRIWIKATLDIGYAQLLTDGFQSTGTDVNCGPRHPMLECFLADETPGDAGFLTVLKSGPQVTANWRWPFRLARQLWRRPIVRAYPKIGRSSADEIVTLMVDPLIEAHASVKGVHPRYRDFASWFSSIQDDRGIEAGAVAEPFLIAAQEALREFGVDPRPSAIGWLRKQFTTSENCIRIHADRVSSTDDVPKRLWTGSSSGFWPLLLAREVMRRDGEVTAHDHGIGSGWVHDPEAHLIVKGFCDEFVTFNHRNSIRISESFSSEGLTSDTNPKTTSLEEMIGKSESLPADTSKSTTPKIDREQRSIMVMPITFMGEITNLTPYPDDVWAHHLNCRLVNDLYDQGIKILLKPHPEFDNSAMQIFVRHYGVEILDGRFEDCWQLADAFVFTHPLSTAFAVALRKGLPTVLIDFGFVDWRRGVIEELENDIVIVPGSADSNGFLSYDKQALRDGLMHLHAVSL